jgi:uncharacterized repeat protein (TIGR03803 family)
MKKCLLVIIIACCISDFTNAQYKKLYDFNCSSGCEPEGLLIHSQSKFYCLTDGGGKDSIGTIFSVDTNGYGYRELHYFSGYDGSHPARSSTLTLINGKLFGTTSFGGSMNQGVVFSIDTNGNNYKVLHNFDSIHGKYPTGQMVASGNKLFGSTFYGGNYYDPSIQGGIGIIFTIDTGGNNFKILLNFNDTNGSLPYTSLLLSGNTLYGTTTGGGKYGQGLVFSIDTNGTVYNDIYNFGSITKDGNAPSMIALSNNVLYGGTAAGGASNLGTIFSIHANGSGYKVLYSCNSFYTGENMHCPFIIEDNKLFSMAQGYSNTCPSTPTCGLLFSIDTNGNSYTNLIGFQDTNGSNTDQCGVTIIGNTIFGITCNGGINNEGVVFRYKDSAVTTSVNELAANKISGISVYPNPATTNIQYTITSKYANPATMQVFNVLGKIVATSNLKLQPGVNTFGLNVSGLSSGVYMLRVGNEEKKFVKE